MKEYICFFVFFALVYFIGRWFGMRDSIHIDDVDEWDDEARIEVYGCGDKRGVYEWNKKEKKFEIILPYMSRKAKT